MDKIGYENAHDLLDVPDNEADDDQVKRTHTDVAALMRVANVDHESV